MPDERATPFVVKELLAKLPNVADPQLYNNHSYQFAVLKVGGLKNGRGIEYYDNSQKNYEGNWVNDKKEGLGTYYLQDLSNSKYRVVDHKNGIMNGKGIEYFSNGEIQFEGNWKDGVKSGIGTSYVYHPFNSENNYKIVCNYVNGKKEGEGKEYFLSGGV